MSKSRTRTITFKGDAARAFLKAQSDAQPVTEKDELEALALAIALKVHEGDMADAVNTLKTFAVNAIEGMATALLENALKQARLGKPSNAHQWQAVGNAGDAADMTVYKCVKCGQHRTTNGTPEGGICIKELK